MTLCARCGEESIPLAEAPLPGTLGERIAAEVCTACWERWTELEIKVINELRLNFMDPSAQATLARHMTDFLFPNDESSSDPAERLDFDALGEPPRES